MTMKPTLKVVGMHQGYKMSDPLLFQYHGIGRIQTPGLPTWAWKIIPKRRKKA